MSAGISANAVFARRFCWLAMLATGIALATPAAAAEQAQHAYPLMLAKGSRLLIAAKVNGHRVEALLDSAAEATIVDRKFAEALHLRPGASETGHGSGKAEFEARIASGVTLDALGLTLSDQTVAIADLGDVGRRLLGKRVDVILGREIFDAARIAIDIDGRRIAVVARDAEPSGVRMQLVTEHEVETIPVTVESAGTVRATFDLGNGSRVLVGRALAERMHLLSDGRKVTIEKGGGLGGEFERQVILLRSLQIAGRSFHDVTAAIDPQESASDLNVGVDLLRHFRITTDFSQHAVWLQPRD